MAGSHHLCARVGRVLPVPGCKGGPRGARRPGRGVSRISNHIVLAEQGPDQGGREGRQGGPRRVGMGRCGAWRRRW